jgi:hypothetical protein
MATSLSAKLYRRAQAFAVRPGDPAGDSSNATPALCPRKGILPIDGETHSTAAAIERRAENCRRAHIGRVIARLPFRIR